MAKSEFICPQCAKPFLAENSRKVRADKIGSPLYCGMGCAGLARRLKNPPTEAERRSAKAEYDKAYREKNRETRKTQKAEWFKRTYDPVKAAIDRKKRAPYHAEYCRRPEYREWKAQYDKNYCAKKEFGEFAEAALLLRDIEQEILDRSTRYEIGLTNGTINKAQKRRRSL